MFPFRIQSKINDLQHKRRYFTVKKCKQRNLASERRRPNEPTARLGASVATTVRATDHPAKQSTSTQ